MLANFHSDKIACRLLEKKKISMILTILVLGNTAAILTILARCAQ